MGSPDGVVTFHGLEGIRVALERGSLEVENVGDHAVVIALSGDWSSAEVEAFVATTVEAVAERKRSIVVDLCDLTFLDSAMLHALLQLHKASEEAAWSFAIVRPEDPALWRSFQVTGLDLRIASYETRSGALLGAR